MKITRVLNTNAVLTTSAEGEETILLGAGLGFKHKPGDEVEEEKVEKRFVLKDKDHQSRFEELLNSIPQQYIMVAEAIISMGKSLYEMRLSESIHISLPDHIYTAIFNKQNGILIPNTLLLEIKQFYMNEYELGCRALELIQQELGCALPVDEAGFIAMHFINAQYGSENTNAKKIIRLVQELNNLVLQELKVTPDETSLNYYRYMTHLKFFAQRIVQDRHYEGDEDTILDAILLKYPKEYLCSRKVCSYVKKNYHYKPSHGELIYLTVHLARLTHF